MFEFLKIQYILGSVDETYLNKMVEKGRITEEEKQQIMSLKGMWN